VKINRIRKTKDFQDVFKNGKKMQGEIFSVHVLKNTGTGTAAGATVAKKFAPRAVKRNYIRRLIFATFREKSASLRKDALFVVRLTRSVGEIKTKPLSKAVRKDLIELLEKTAGIT
jgi:ribonuclease P protein component